MFFKLGVGNAEYHSVSSVAINLLKVSQDINNAVVHGKSDGDLYIRGMEVISAFSCFSAIYPLFEKEIGDKRLRVEFVELFNSVHSMLNRPTVDGKVVADAKTLFYCTFYIPSEIINIFTGEKGQRGIFEYETLVGLALLYGKYERGSRDAREIEDLILARLDGQRTFDQGLVEEYIRRIVGCYGRVYPGVVNFLFN
jgi:hypothetical protein